jgi:acyl-coenzyme A thioesterase PaaI-like protein
MGDAHDSPGERLRALWKKLSPLPGGRWMFSRMVGFMAPYSGTIGATIETLEPGYCKVSMRDRRGVRQHLNSVHAIALANLGEMASGLAMSAALPPHARGIVTNISVKYLKKARGTLTAECRTELPDLTVASEQDFYAPIHDEAGDEVARVTATWKLGPVKTVGRAS